MAKHLVRLNVNGGDHVLVVESTERLLDVLRDRLNLKGAKEGCGKGDCGTCAVIIDGQLVNSCLVLAIQARDKKIVTIEIKQAISGILCRCTGYYKLIDAIQEAAAELRRAAN